MTDDYKLDEEESKLVLQSIGVPRPEPRDHSRSEYEKVPWTPFVEGTIPERWRGETIAMVNSRYQVFISKQRTKFGPCVHLSIKTHDRSAWHDWRDYQRIKNELLGPEWEAVELYPAESRLVDTANQYHLWCFEKGVFEFGFSERLVQEEDGLLPLQRQRPFEK